MTVRVRFAPSPTGNLHIGGVRTALFNYAFAKHHGGTFVLRIEDTDQQRSTKEFETSILEGMKWLGMDWDEGPEKGGEYGPYHQMERIELYKKYAQQLIDEDQAYYCFCTAEELAAKREAQMARKEDPKYDGTCRNITKAEALRRIEAGESCSIRYKTPEKKLVFNDLIRGDIEIDTAALGDLIIMKSDGSATYNFACVIDDASMEITHIIRGEDHIPNTPKQILIFETLGFPVPQYAHLPMILGEDKSKLSKRHGATNVVEYKKLGYYAPALVNFLGLLGWSHPKEKDIFSLEEMTKLFELKRVNKSGAVFDTTKLNWMNGQYIKGLEKEDYLKIARQAGPEPKQYEAQWDRILILIQKHLSRFDEIKEKTQVLFSYNEMTPEAAEYTKNEGFSTFCSELHKLMTQPEYEEKQLMQCLKASGKEAGLKGKDLYMSLRIGITGETGGFELSPLVEILGSEQIIARLEHTLEIIK